MKNVATDRIIEAIALREDFQIKAPLGMRQQRTPFLIRGYDPYACFGFHGPGSMRPGLLDDAQWRQLQRDMETEEVAYVVESHGTVIAWQTGAGVWKLMPRMHTLAMSRHQSMVIEAISHGRSLHVAA